MSVPFDLHGNNHPTEMGSEEAFGVVHRPGKAQVGSPSQTLTALMEQRAELENRLLEFDRILKKLKAARLQTGLTPAVADMQHAVERLDSDLTQLANVVHDLCAEFEQRALLDSAGPKVEAVIFARVAERVFAIRVSEVEEIRAWHGEAASSDHKIVSLCDSLGLPQTQRTGNERLLLLRGIESSALLVDEIVRQDEVIIRSLGPLLAGMKLYCGAAVAPRGELVLVVDGCEILRRAEGHSSVS